MKPAIRVENLSKQYRIGAKQDGYTTLRESLARAASAPLRRLRGMANRNGHDSAAATADDNTIWALKDVSFEVQPGEVVGIIGRNGAGKSTLLKILSRITEPTNGRIRVNGRVGSLLEVGTGFHPELTGRENVYMNGAILGMGRKEIDRKFDEIIEFSGVERFLDTPIKRYSSGMQVRLAFAVAAHLRPEILVVDEVLAVGDAEFQKKCLGKMQDVAQSGRTVLFVSHNMAAITNLCTRGLVLRGGALDADQPIHTAVTTYRSYVHRNSDFDISNHPHRRGNGHFRIVDFKITSLDTRSASGTVHSGAPTSFELTLSPVQQETVLDASFAITIFDLHNTPLLTLYSNLYKHRFTVRDVCTTVVCNVPRLPLAQGEYTLTLWSSALGAEVDVIEHAARLVVSEGDFFASGAIVKPHKHGPMLVDHSWRLASPPCHSASL